MQCPTCGAQIPDQVQFCPNCGASVNQTGQLNGMPGQYGPNGQYNMNGQYGPNNQPYGASGVNTGPRMSAKEFYNHPAMKSCKSSIIGSAIVLYVCAGITLFANVLLTRNPLGILDVLLLAGLGLGIHLGKSRVCAIIILAYGLFNVVITFISYHRLGGWLIPLAAIYAVISTFKYHKAWEAYQATGILPIQ